MTFRRQDIPKTTRRVEDGPRRLYPRYLRDDSVLPSIGLAIDFLERMRHRRREEIPADTVLDVFGDLKVARCVLACLADEYRYRSPEFGDVLDEAALSGLAGWDLLAPADLRAHVYGVINDSTHGGRGFIVPVDRGRLLDEVGTTLGIGGGELDRLMTLDAERNAVLDRTGLRPEPVDVRARYNVTLLFSLLRHASSVTLELPGLADEAVAAVAGRYGVPWRRDGDVVHLTGRRATTGTWAGFGGRVARAAMHLIVLHPSRTTGEATVHLGDRTCTLLLDAKAMAVLRPKSAHATRSGSLADVDRVIEAIQTDRRGVGLGGWTMRRMPAPVTNATGLVLPDLAFTRDGVTVGLLVTPAPGTTGTTALAAVESCRPLIVLGNGSGSNRLSADALSVPALLDRLDAISAEVHAQSDPMTAVAAELEMADRSWVPDGRIHDLLGPAEIPARWRTPAGTEVVHIPGFGICRPALLDTIQGRLGSGPGSVLALRDAIADVVADGPAADALTLHLLRDTVVTLPGDGAGRAVAA